ncbi:MAG: hypothetical protein COV70_01715 [Parcubacteria group bacterium CG11_big_fil_rev_8_21_14_0_20_39_22]|nr:MAG: hypothetical protein COV70_01715 [Parcubacteria group bacterium CG11_big_fil_rev_8_21_14_0_20_39_22]
MRVVNLNPGAGTATVLWETNLDSTSRVVYGLSNNGPYSLNVYSPNFGYSNGTSISTNLTRSHSVDLSGLVVGEVYRYRVSSSQRVNSLPTISDEKVFVLTVAVPPQTGGGTVTPPVVSGGGGAPIFGEPGTITEHDDEDLFDDRNLAASIFGLPESWTEFFICLSILLLIILIAYLVWIYWGESYVKKRFPKKNQQIIRNIFIICWCAIAIIVSLIFGELCLWLPLLIIIIIAIVHAIMVNNQEKKS